MCIRDSPYTTPVIAEKRSIIIIAGIKYLALIGIGKNSSINLLSGKNIANATNIPIIAPDAPTIVELKFEKIEATFSIPTLLTKELISGLLLLFNILIISADSYPLEIKNCKST